MKGSRKSQPDVEFYVGLFENVLRDCLSAYPSVAIDVELDRDMRFVRRRAKHEGISFFTKALPALGRAVDASMEDGCFTPCPGFARLRRGGEVWKTPAFLSALFSATFDSDGRLLANRDTAIPYLRQLCYMLYKLEVPFTDEQTKRYAQKFKDVDASLTAELPKWDTQSFRVARMFLRKLFKGFNPEDIEPGHGPGAVAEGAKARDKYLTIQDTYIRALDGKYPYVRYISRGILLQDLESLTAHTRKKGSLPPSRVCFVPKDSRGPRVIAAEPAVLQYLQQGLGRRIVEWVERHDLTRGRVLFTNQRTHQRLALRASLTGSHATLDLQDASDRVSTELVKRLFPANLVPYLLALRSDTATLLKKETVTLNKYASMGSALCFPVEALTFYALSVGAVWQLRHALEFPGIFVYGDDIICRTEFSQRIRGELETYGVRFSDRKCFEKGKFRESCGCDAFQGEDVTPVRVRALVDADPRLASLIPLNKNANAFFDRGYWRTSEYLHSYVESRWGELPTALPTFNGLARTSSVLPPCVRIPRGVRKRWNKDYQVWEVRTLRLRARKMYSPFPDYRVRLGYDLNSGPTPVYQDEVAVRHSALTKVTWGAVD